MSIICKQTKNKVPLPFISKFLSTQWRQSIMDAAVYAAKEINQSNKQTTKHPNAPYIA
jgi:hypothetical protein